ncbi:hypothetical protein ACLK1T_21235 [Escherichia coli]
MARSRAVIGGRQWFSVQGITEDNRRRVWMRSCRRLSKRCAAGRTERSRANATALIGFSQGAIMVLESIKAEPGLASRVIAFNGRLCEPAGNCVYSHDNSPDSWR